MALKGCDICLFIDMEHLHFIDVTNVTSHFPLQDNNVMLTCLKCSN